VARRVSWADLAIVGGARPGAQLRLTDTDIYGRRLTAFDTDAEKLARRSRAASPAPLLVRGPRQDTGLRSLPLQGYAQLHLKSPRQPNSSGRDGRGAKDRGQLAWQAMTCAPHIRPTRHRYHPRPLTPAPSTISMRLVISPLDDEEAGCPAQAVLPAPRRGETDVPIVTRHSMSIPTRWHCGRSRRGRVLLRVAQGVAAGGDGRAASLFHL